MVEDNRSVALLALGTAVPSHRIQQTVFEDWMNLALEATPALRRRLRRLYEVSGIETRYSCVPDYTMPPEESRFSPGHAQADMPTTADRMAIYRREAPVLSTLAAERALADFDGSRDDITHLIVVSCTGFFAPGLDQAIAKELHLRPTVERTLVGFMGCAAGMNGLRLAQQIVSGNPQARVLLVCVELCSLHMVPGDSRVNLVVTSLFGDGAAACVVGAAPSDGRDHFIISSYHTELVPDTTQDMVWEIGNYGFTMHLSPDIPRLLAEVAPHAIGCLFGEQELPQFWAIHPGGRGIVDRLAELFQLTPEQSAPSLDVLRHYGNMSSPTLLFVLDELRARLRHAEINVSSEGVAMAFGPGLVIEMARLTYQPMSTSLRIMAGIEREQTHAYVA